MQNNTKRIDWIDTLRGLAMFFVIWGHSIINKNGFFRKYIYSFHMPLFFIISGLTFNESDKLPFKEFIKKRIKSLIIPYLIINIVCCIPMVIFSKIGVIKSFDLIENIVGIFYGSSDVIHMPSGPSWFLLTLFITEIIFYFLKKNSKSDFNLLFYSLVIALISYANSLSKYQVLMPFHLDAALMGVLFYYIGYIFIKNIKKFDFIFNSKIRMFTYGAIFGLIGFVGSYLNRRVSMNANHYGSITLFLLACLLTSFALLLFVKLFLKKSFIFKNIGKNTIFYLGYSNLLIFSLKYYFSGMFKGHIKTLLMAIIITLIILPISMFVKKYCGVLIGKIKIKALEN